ncbi:MAG: hypothetical protein JWN78_3288 [Bacteroidota bacterium]|nr:hypothetical protein [Bacteroidota bacterium]
MNTDKVLLGALAGFATGALMGIFFAPHKGSDLRRKISDSGRDYANDLKDKFNNFVDSLNDKFESTKDQAENVLDQGKAGLNDIRKDHQRNSQKSTAGTATSGSGAGTY